MNILIIDDTDSTSSIISKTLSSYGFTPHIIPSSDTIKSTLKFVPLSIIIINTNLIHADSFDICSHIRKEYPHTSILAIHTSGPWQARVEILQNGADDCISFPFPTQELIARIRALQRRPRRSQPATLLCGNISIKPNLRLATFHDRELDLTRKEYNLLEYLVRNNDRVVTRSELLDHVWDYTRIINSNTVDVHIRKLRSKLREHQPKRPKRSKSSPLYDMGIIPRKQSFPQNSEIKTVHGVGYRLNGNLPRNKEEKDSDILRVL